MALPRYSPSEVGLQPGTASVVHQQRAKTWATLSDKLNQFSGAMVEQAGKQRAMEAEEQAYQDTIDGKPFHKESVHTVYGQAYNNTRKATYSAQLEMDINAKSAEYAEQFKYDEMGYRNAMQGYMKGIREETPDSAIEASLTISGGKLIQAQSEKIKQASIARQQKLDLEVYDQFRQEQQAKIINARLSGDTATEAVLIQQLDEYTTSLMHSDTITDKKFAEDFKDNLFTVEKGVKEGELQKLVDDNDYEGALKYIEDYNKKIPSGLTKKEYDSIKSSMNTIYNNSVKAKNTQIKELKKNATSKADDNITVYKNGQAPKYKITDDEMALLDDSKREALEVAEASYNANAQLTEGTLLEKEKQVTKLKNASTGYETKVYKELESDLKQEKAAWKKDPVSEGINRLGHENFTISITDEMEDFKTKIGKRKTQSLSNYTYSGQGKDHLLTELEAEQMRTFIEGEDIASQMAFAQKITDLGREDAIKIFNQVSEKQTSTFTTVGKLVTQGKTLEAELILNGEKLGSDIKVSTAFAPQSHLTAIIGQNDRQTYLEYAGNVESYAKGYTMRYGNEPSTTKAIESIYGKIESYNGKKIFLPKNVSENTFTEFLKSYKIEGMPQLTKQINEIPDWFDSGLQLHYDDTNKYLLFNPKSGRYIKDDKGDLVEIIYNADK